MIRLALALRWALLRGALRSGRGSTGRRLGLAAGAVIGLGLAVLTFAGLAALRGTATTADDAAVVLFTGLLVGWTVLPIVTFTSDDLLDASKLALLPLSTGDVLVLHGVGALLGIAPIATLVACLGLVAATGDSLVSYGVAVVAVPLELALCVALSRTTAASLARLLRSRRGRDLGVALTALVAVSGQLVNPLLQRAGRSQGAEQALHQAASVLSALPPGLLASAPRLAADGQLPLAVLHLIGGAIAVAALLALWARALRRAELSIDATTAPSRSSTGLTPRLLTRVLPAGRIGAVAGKDLRYLVRDPRRLVQLVTGTVFPAFFVVVVPLLSPRGHPHATMVFAVCGVAVLAVLGGSNRFGQDGTATWMLLAAGSDRRAARRDLLGGDLALMLIVVPLMVALGVLLAAVTGGWRYLPAAEGLGLAILGLSLGAAAVVAVVAPFPLPEGSRNAFTNGGGGQGLLAAALVFGVFAVVAITCAPLVVLLVLVLHPDHGVPLLLLGPLYGAALGTAARELAATLWSERGPEVLLRLSARPG